jgi:hypothetical protein
VRREKKRLRELAAQASLTLIDEQVRFTRDVLNNEKMAPHHRASLLRSLDGLMERERVFRQDTPRAGTVKTRPGAPLAPA